LGGLVGGLSSLLYSFRWALVWPAALIPAVPAGLAEDEHGVGAGRDRCAELGEMRLHDVSQ
jgi:hypothetical protein